MTQAADIRAAYNELREAVGVDASIDAEDDLWLRLSEVDIELKAAEVTLARSDDEPVRQTAALKLHDIDGRLAELARDVLGYYALVAEPEGANEPPVGGEPVRRLRSRFLAARLDDEIEVIDIRDRLAAWLERHGP